MCIPPARVNRCESQGLQVQLVLARRPAAEKPGEVQPFHEGVLTTGDGTGTELFLTSARRTIRKVQRILVKRAAPAKCQESILSVSSLETRSHQLLHS